MKPFLRSVATFFHISITGVHPPKGFLSTVFLLMMLLFMGTVFYSWQEGWSYFDSFYFSVITITTVGYGDFHPTTPLSKLFTIFFIFAGVGIGLYVITTFANSIQSGRERRIKKFRSIFKGK